MEEKKMKNWTVSYSEYKPEEEKLREALCTTGNGYFATRGSLEGTKAGEVHYPGTYLAGGYNRLETSIAGKIIVNEDLVNWPDWTVLKFKDDTGEWFDPEKVKILEYLQELDLYEGTLRRNILFEDARGRRTNLLSRRFVSMRDPHRAAIEWTITPRNWSGSIVVHSAIDGSVINAGVPRYRDLNSHHLEVLEAETFGEHSIFLKARTLQSELIMTQAASTRIYVDSLDFSVKRESINDEKYVAQELSFDVEENKSYHIEKLIAVYTSRDAAISNATDAAKKSLLEGRRFGDLQKEHIQAWKEIWQRCDTVLDSDHEQDQLLLRFHIFHLLQTCSDHTIDLDAGIPARGWHGEAYRGHIFWDELFIFPFIITTYPELTRALLMYRYRRLPEARYAAREACCRGAMFPWQSGSSGREETQVIHLNPASGNWLPDNTHLQRHVNAAIAYNVWQYFQVSADLEFLYAYGAELLMDIANFWAGIAHFNEERQRFEIHNVVGPDEYHTAYPGSAEPGLKNSAYTNIMAVWTIIHALEALALLDETRAEELLNKLSISKEDLNRWDKITRTMFVPFINNNKVIEQFEGFDGLKDLDWDKYHKEHGEELRLDRILENEGDEVNKYKAVKQADVLMLFYLLSPEELDALFHRMGYDFNTVERFDDNMAYYEKITSHGSTLSKLIHSWVFARSRREESWHSFKKALVSDFEDIQGGTTPEGIHLGAMAGTVDLIRRCYTGMEFRDEALWFNPQVPFNVKRINFKLQYKDHWLEVDLTANKLCLTSHGGWKDQIVVVVKGEKYKLRKGQKKGFSFNRKTRSGKNAPAKK